MKPTGKHGPTHEHMAMRVLKDMPDLELRAGDVIYASSTLGVSLPGNYVVACKDHNGEAYLTFVGHYDRLTKKGTPRKVPLIGEMRLTPRLLNTPHIEIRHVDWVFRPSESVRRKQARAEGCRMTGR